MSWPQWAQTAVPPVPQPPPAPANSVPVPVASAPAAIPPAPTAASYSTGMTPPASYTPAQFAALPTDQQFAIQQNWQQWQTYHQQYAQWHAQYGEQYQREMQAKLGVVAPSLPFVPPVPPYNATAAPPAPTTYSVPPPPPIEQTNILNTPNISAAASQPPPPPPPVEEIVEKKVQSFEHPAPPVNPIGPVSYPIAPPPPPDDPMPPQQFKEQLVPNQMQLQQQQSFQQQQHQQFQQQQQQNQFYQRPLQQQDSQLQNRYQQHPESHLQNRYQSLEPQQQNRFQQQDSPHQNRFQQQETQQNRFQQQEPQQQNRFQQQESQKQNRFQQQESPQQNRYQQQEPQQQNRYQQQELQQQNRYQQQEPQQQNRFQQQQSPQWKPNNDSRTFNDRRGGFDGNDRNRNNFEDNFNNRGGRDWGRADSDTIGRNPWQSNQQPFQGPVQIQRPNDQSNLNQQPPGQLSQSLTQTPEKQKPDESSGDVDGEKTPEEKAFDEQFQKWEEQFENWKKENANHPDRKAYREYEMKFEDCRRKLLERREVMKKRKIEKKLKEEQEIKMREEYQRSLMPKVEEQEKMREEHQRSLMPPKVEDNVKEHQSNLPANIGDDDIELQQIPPPPKKEEHKVVNMSDASKEVEVKTDPVPEQKEVKEELKQENLSKPSKEVSSDKTEQEEVVEFLKTTKSEGGIPGLDLVAEEKPVDKGIDEDITEVIDLEVETKPERGEEKPTSSVRFPDHRPEMNQMNMSMMGSPNMIPDRQPIFSSINRIDPPQGKREIPSLLSQKFEMPVMSPPGDNRRSFDIFDNRKNVEEMNQQSPFNKHLNNDHRVGFDNFEKDVKNVEVLSQQNAFHQQPLGDDRGNSDNFENNRKNVPVINQPNSFNEQSPKDGGREDFDNFDNNRNNAQGINQQPSNESFGKFLENTVSNKVGNDANSNLGVDDKGNVPTGIAELANVLADPNVLALLSAAIGNNGGGGGSGDVGGVGNIMHGLTELENQSGGSKMSPWAMGQAPFQAQNQMFPNQLRGGPQQGGNFRDFGGGGGGSHNNSGNMWQDQNQSNSNSPWSNRNLGDNRGNMQPWQNRSNRQDDFRRGGNWSNRDRDMGDRKNTSWQDDVDMRSNMFDRNIFGSGGGGDERSRSSERMADRERVNPFKDHDDRGGRANTFGNNDRERGRQRENRGDRSRSGGSRNNNNNNRDRSRSSGNSGGRQDENSNSGSHRNPFKNEQNIFDKSPAPSIPSLGGLQHGGGGNNDEFFRPAHVIDYQNKSLGGGGGDGCGDVGGSEANENDNIVLPTKVVDYGHGGNNSEQGGNKDFFPMKTIDYGHSSANNPNFESNLEGRRNDFNAGRNRNRNRNRNNNNKKKSGLPQESNSTYPGPWFLFNVTSQQRPGLPTKRGKRRKTIRNLYENEFLITPDCGTDSFFFEQADKLYETLENVDDISEDDNDFDAFESNNPSEIEELDDAVVVGTPSPVSEDIELVPVFPIKEITPPPESIKKPQLIVPTTENNNTITIDEILLKPGRESRPKKIVIILRGPPGSGKSYVAKLIKDKEVEFGGSTPRLLSIDDYFMTEIDKEEKCLNTGRKIIKKEMVYEYEKEMEQNYMQYLIKSFKKTVNDRLFNFVIVDCVNYSLRTFTEFYNNAKSANFTPYTIDLLCDLDTCLCRNIHNRSIKDIQHILDNWTPTPDQYIKLDVRSLIQSAAIREFKTEDAPDMVSDAPFYWIYKGERASDNTELSQEQNDYSEEVSNFLKSKWDVDSSEDKLARLDGTSKPLQKNTTIEDYLQMDGWQSPPATSKKKRVRWADIEEKRAQDKMRAIGFVVGQTDWSRMMDPTAGSSALTKTKYIAKVKKRK